MKSLITVSAVCVVLLLGACSIPDSGMPPMPAGPPAGSDSVTIVVEGHDRDDFPKVIPFTMNLMGVAANPDLLGAFVDPDSGESHPFRDPVTRANLPVILERATAYSATIYFPVGEQITFTLNVFFWASYGDVVHCYFRDDNGNEIPRTRQFFAQFGVSKDNPKIQAMSSVSCMYTVNAA